jgi:hypothetical protein
MPKFRLDAIKTLAETSPEKPQREAYWRAWQRETG